MLDPILLRTFVTVAQEKGFSRAAAVLSLTQSAISGHLRRLEAQLGVELMRRTTRSLVLTEEGRKLMVYANAILALGRDALAEVGGQSGQGRLRLGISEDFARQSILATLRQFMARHPSLALEVSMGIPGTLLRQMQEGTLDLVMGSQCEQSGLGQLIGREPLLWAGLPDAEPDFSHPLPLAFFPEPCPYREAALARLAKAGIKTRIAMTCTSYAGMREAVLSGFAIAPMTRSQMAEGLVALTPGTGLPRLPEVQFRLFTGAGASPLVLMLAQALIEAASGQAGPRVTFLSAPA